MHKFAGAAGKYQELLPYLQDLLAPLKAISGAFLCPLL